MKQLLAIAAALVLVATEARAVCLEIRLREGDGDVYYAVYDSPQSWLRTARAVARGRVRAEAGRTRIELPALKSGVYAVAAFRDLDGDGRLTTGFLGIPQEPVAFSGRAKAVVGPPRFDAARVQTTSNQGQIEVRFD